MCLKLNLCIHWFSLYLKQFCTKDVVVLYKSSRREVFCKKGFLENSQNSQENTCVRVSFSIKLQAKACKLIKKENFKQVFSCEFCKICRSIFLTEHLRWLLLAVHLSPLNNRIQTAPLALKIPRKVIRK